MKLLEKKIGTSLVLIVLGVSCLASGEKQKRQIYREQVLPALGGKIPEEAFRTDRLALNRLNKDGIAVIDGIILEARDHDKNPDSVRSKPELIKVYVTQDPRYVPPEGRHYNEYPKSVETTYVLRKPVGHHDGSEQQRLNGIGNAPVHQQHQYRHHNQNNINNRVQNIGGYTKLADIPPQSLSPPKAHGFSNVYNFPSYSRPQNHHPRRDQYHYQTIYKPIITPLIIPAQGLYYRKPYQQNLQNHRFDHPLLRNSNFNWGPTYQREPLFFDDNSNFFDSHQIITDYKGFLNTFHGRPYRHVGSPKDLENQEKFPKNNGDPTRFNTFSDERRSAIGSSDKSEKANLSIMSKNDSPLYTNLTSIPTTEFSCDGRRGTYADVETKCQVFHECSGWSKTTSLCPVGTAYSAIKKRCEWWNNVACNSQ